MKTLAFRNLGCSKNVVDGEAMIAWMESAGIRLVETPSSAEIIVVNTCAFISAAKEEAIEEIIALGQFKKKGQCRVLAVAGCFSERYGRQSRKLLPEVDLWLSLKDWKKELSTFLGTRHQQASQPRHLTGLTAVQYLKIADGCSHRCAFCAIPLIRGPYHSRRLEAILDEAKWLESQGVRECILVSQDTSYYGRDIGTDLVRLLEKILSSVSFPWLRLMYLHPSRITPELLRLIATEPRICPYFDIPLQHSADPILRAMRRSPLHRGTCRCIESIRENVPNAAIRTTFITGFPGETEAHFQQLLRFVAWARFDKAGVFPFSPEEHTEAVKMPRRPRTDTAQRRCQMLLELQRNISARSLASRTGSIIPVIIDRPMSDEPGCFEARSRWDAPEVDGVVHVRNARCKAGDIIEVKVTGTDDYDMQAIPAGTDRRQKG